MKTIVITQDDMSSLAGARDGVFYSGAAAPSYTDSDFHAGYHYRPNASPAFVRAFAYVRFKLPFIAGGNYELHDAFVTFNWRQRSGVPGNVGIGQEPNALRVALAGPAQAISGGGDILWPGNNTAGLHFIDAATTANQVALWSNASLKNDPGIYEEPVRTSNLKDQLDPILKDATWAEDKHVLILFALETPYLTYQINYNRYWVFHTWSELVADSLSTVLAPTLTVKYTYKTPVPQAVNHVEHVLDVQQSIDEVSINECKTDALNIAQTITPQTTYNRSVTSKLTLLQDILRVGTQSASIETRLLLGQDVKTSSPKRASVEHDLDIIQTLTNNYLEVSVEHALDIEQTISAPAHLALSVTSTLDVDHDVDGQRVGNEFDYANDVLDIQQTVTTNVVASRSLEHVLTINQSVLAWVDNGASASSCRAEYVGKTITLLDGGDVTLTYDVLSLTLPCPRFGNVENYQVRRIQRDNLGGDLIVYRDPTWPKQIDFRMEFEALTDTEKDDLKAFLIASLGKEVGLTDHEGRSWTVLIVDPKGHFSEVFNTCGHTAQLYMKVVE